jgi:hypothetical protein
MSDLCLGTDEPVVIPFSFEIYFNNMLLICVSLSQIAVSYLG